VSNAGAEVGASVQRRAFIAALATFGLAAAGSTRWYRSARFGQERARTPSIPLYPSLTADLFRPGTSRVLATGGVAVSQVVSGGLLRLPSGRLTVADPGWATRKYPDDVGPLTETVGPGAYPLSLAVLDDTVAAVRLTLRDQPVVSWDLGLRAGEDPSTLRPNYFFGAGVDTGTLAFFDESAHDELARRVDAQEWSFDVDAVSREVPDVAPGANVIQFVSGFGDGEYPVWIGRTSDGAVGCFLADMQILAPVANTTAQPWSWSPRPTRSPGR
jgi:Protein of unknown function (DUF4241)